MCLAHSFQLKRLEELITLDQKHVFTLISYVLTFAVYINLSTFKLPALGIGAFFLYFLINGTFLTHAFFEKEDVFLKSMLGVLLLIMLLGFVGWIIMIIYNLDVINFTLVLVIVATLSSAVNRRVKD